MSWSVGDLAEHGTLLMRKFACCYAQGRPGAREFRGNVARVITPTEFHEVVDRYFPRMAPPRASDQQIRATK